MVFKILTNAILKRLNENYDILCTVQNNNINISEKLDINISISCGYIFFWKTRQTKNVY